MCVDYLSECLNARSPTCLLGVLSSRSSVGASVCTAGYGKVFLLVQLHKCIKELAGCKSGPWGWLTMAALVWTSQLTMELCNTPWFIVYLHIKLPCPCQIWVPGSHSLSSWKARQWGGPISYVYLWDAFCINRIHAGNMVRGKYNKKILNPQTNKPTKQKKNHHIFLQHFTCFTHLCEFPDLLPETFQSLYFLPFPLSSVFCDFLSSFSCSEPF